MGRDQPAASLRGRSGESAAAAADGCRVGRVWVTVVTLSGGELFSGDMDPRLTIQECKRRMREIIDQPGCTIKLVCGTEVLGPDDAEVGALIGSEPAIVTLTHCAQAGVRETRDCDPRVGHGRECGTWRQLDQNWRVCVLIGKVLIGQLLMTPMTLSRGYRCGF
jgi:hypothetical protein